MEEERKAQEAEARKKQAVRSLLGSAYFDSDEEEDEEEESEWLTPMSIAASMY